MAILSPWSRQKASKRRSLHRRRIGLLEALEDRRLLATITVNSLADNLDDDHFVTLREAIQAANTDTSVSGSVAGSGDDTIVFRQNLQGTIPLTLGELLVSSSVEIVGPGADKLTVSGSNLSRVFRFASGAASNYEISGLTISDGVGVTSSSDLTSYNPGFGGAVQLVDSDDTLVIRDSVIRDSKGRADGTGNGGGIFVLGGLTLHNSAVINNEATEGGGLSLSEVDASLTNVTISGNVSRNRGGGILHWANGADDVSYLKLTSSTVADNSAPNGSAIATSSFNNAIAVETEYINTIFADNVGSDNFRVADNGGTGAVNRSLGHNLSDDSSGNLTNLGDQDGADPKLGPLGIYGGDIPVHPLHSDSPAIDTGVPGYRDQVAGNSFRALYEMNDDVEQTTVVDNARSTATTLNGTAMGGVRRADGAPISDEVHNAIDFNGTDAYVSVPHDSLINPTSLTIEAWARVDGGAGTFRTLVKSRDDTTAVDTDGEGFVIYAGNNDRWQFWTGDGDQTSGFFGEWDVLFGPSVVIGEWVHLVATFQRTGTRGNASLGTKSFYINGELAATRTDALYRPNGSAPLYIGAGDTENAPDPPKLFFDGAIDEVGIGSTALTESQVAFRYEATKMPSDDARAGNRFDGNDDIGAFEGAIDSIGINFVGGRNGFAGGTVTGEAGVVPQSNWNNVADNDLTSTGGNQTGEESDLKDALGNASTADIAWNTSNTWGITAQPAGDENGSLMLGYLDTSATSNTNITVDSIPYSAYDVYVYIDGDTNGRTGSYRITDGFKTLDSGDVLDNATWPIAGGGVFVESGGSGDGGNYYVFRGLSGSSFDLIATPSPFRAPINAIQIVGVAPRLIVDTLGDIDDGDPTDGMTLREALSHANALPGHQVIEFDLGDDSQSILLDGNQLEPTDDVTIVGPGASQLTINAQSNSRVMNIASGVSVTLQDLTVAGGEALSQGGGIRNEGELTLDRVTVENNFSNGDLSRGGGGIWTNGESLDIRNSTFRRNKTIGFGGGIQVNTGSVDISSSTFVDNEALEGGALKVQNGDVRVTNSTLSRNHATQRGGALQLGGSVADFLPNVLISSSTITDNTSGNLGGGIEVSNALGQLSVIDSIIAGNVAPIDPQISSLDPSRVAFENSTLIDTAFVGPLGNHAIQTQAIPPNHGRTETQIPLPGNTDNVPAVNYDAAVLASAPVAYWRLSDDAAGTAANLGSIGSAVDGVVVGGVTPANGLIGNSSDAAFRFDGLGARVNIPSNSELNLSPIDQYTVELTFRSDDVNTRQVLYQQGGFNNGVNVYIENSQLYVGVWAGNGDAGTGGFSAYRHVRIQAGFTHHVALVFDATGTPSLDGYLNGSRIGSEINVGTLAGIPTHTGLIAIGSMRNGSRFVSGALTEGLDGLGFHFEGVIDEVAVYRRALDVFEIGQHVAAANATGVDQNGVIRPQNGLRDQGAVEVIPEDFVSTITVNALGDVDDGDLSNGQTTLREAVNAANRIEGPQTILFNLPPEPQTIVLSGGELKLSSEVQISGMPSNNITIDADGRSRVFHVAPGADAILTNLNLTGGNAGSIVAGDPESWGGGILVDRGELDLFQVNISNSRADYGGGVALNGRDGQAALVVAESYIHDNGASRGAGIYANGTDGNATATINGSTIAWNERIAGSSRSSLAFGVYSIDSHLDIDRSTISENSSGGVGIDGNSGTSNITDTTIAYNENGPSLQLQRDATLQNSIVAANPGVLLISAAGGTLSGTHNLITDPGSTGSLVHGMGNNIVGQDDGLGGREILEITGVVGQLIDNGGFGPTHALKENSPAVGAGSSSESDQRGFPRDNGAADIGAYERQTTLDSVFTVDTTSDVRDVHLGNPDGRISLRDAVSLANESPGNDRIQFNLSDDARIVLSGDPLSLGENVTIDGGFGVIVDGNSQSAVFQIERDAEVEMIGLTIAGGRADRLFAGGINVIGSLVLRDSQVINNLGRVGGIFSNGLLTIVNSTIAGNRNDDRISNNLNGGGIYLSSSSKTSITNSTISSNHALDRGGGIYNSAGDLTITSSTITNNSAEAQGGGIYGRSGIANQYISSSIIAGNESLRDADLGNDGFAEYISLGNNLLHQGAGLHQGASLHQGAGASAQLWDFGTGANNHAYQVVSVPGGVDWEDAREAARRAGGYLATITSAEENDFIFTLIDDPTFWSFQGTFGHGPWIGGLQTAESVEPDQGWTWADDGSPLTYENWSASEPSNSSGTEDRIHFNGRNSVPDKTWNDNWGGSTRPVAYVIEFDNAIYSSSDLIGVDPMLGPLLDNGGPTLTHGLLPGSPAIDAAPRPLIADSVRDWSFDGTQGEKGWTYGYYNQTADGDGVYQTDDLIPFLNDGSEILQTDPVDVNHWTGSEWDFETTPPWTGIQQELMHPNGTNSGVNHWAIRRWTSGYTGLVDIDYTVDKIVAGGDGVTAVVFVNGVEISRQDVGGDDLDPVETNVTSFIVAGDVVDIALTAGGTDTTSNDRFDRADITMQIAPRFDQRGFDRVQGAQSDIGSVEGIGSAATIPLIVNSLGDFSDGDYNNGVMTLREAIQLSNAWPGQQTITFDLPGESSDVQTITLGGSRLTISDSVILDGTGGPSIEIDADGQSRVISINPLVDAVEIVGLTIRGGDTSTENPILTVGGGIYNQGAQLTIRDSTLTDNQSPLGGGLYSLADTIIVDSTFDSNTATSGGGAIRQLAGDLVLKNSRFSDNEAGGSGGAIAASSTNIRGSGLVFANNSSRSSGGAIDNRGALDLAYARFEGNQSERSSGGAVFNGGTASFVHSAFDSNRASTDGGAIFSGTRSQLTLENSSLINGQADFGGAVYSDRSYVTIAGTTFSGNTARLGGAIRTSASSSVPDSYFTIRSSTIVNNEAEQSGGGISRIGSGGTFSVDSTVIANNRAGIHTADLVGPASVTSGGNNLIHAGGGGTLSQFGNNYYEVVTTPGISWEDARAQAIAAGGRLAHIETQAENDFVKGLINDSQYWRSFEDNGNFSNFGPWIGGIQSKGVSEADEGYRWGGRFSVSYFDWHANEPSDTGGNEDALHYFSVSAGAAATIGGWNDNWRLDESPVAYVIEYDRAAFAFGDGDLVGIDPMLGAVQNNGGFAESHAPLPGSPLLNVVSEVASYADVILADSPLVYYPMNETVGNVIADASGNNTNAFSGPTPPDAPGLVLGENSLPGLGTSPKFTNGAPDTFVRVPNLGTHNAVTVEAWIRPESLPQENDFDVIYNSRNFATGALHLQRIHTGGIRLTINSGGQADFGSVTEIPLDRWTHLVATYDNSVNEAKVYANGVLLSTSTFGANQDVVLSTADIGIWNGSVREFDGKIDEFALYTSVLSPERVLAHYQAGFLPPATEQRGAPFERTAGTATDIGAIETQTVSGMTLLVDNPVDEFDGDYSAGDLSLREAIGLANGSVGPDTITFTSAAQMITLQHGQLEITDSVTITSDGLDASIVVSANGQSRVFKITEGDVTFDGIEITGGSTSGDNADAADTTHSGAGILMLSGGTLDLISSTVEGNTTSGNHASGAGIASTVGTVILNESTVAGNNTAGERALGGGIWIGESAELSVIRSTISENRTVGMFAEGGGIAALGGPIEVLGSTITLNATSGIFADGGGLYVADTEANVSPRILRSIIASNQSLVAGGPDFYADPDASVNVTFSLIGDETSSGLDSQNPGNNLIGTATVTLDPRLGPLMHNGGKTRTHGLLPGSPALNASDASEGTDQRGVTRPQGVGADIGAYESLGVFDFGDAPDTYGTTLLALGPAHEASGPRLGPTRDGESDGQPSPNSDGDGNDEDGVMFGFLTTSLPMSGINIDLQNAEAGFVDAWIDFDANGRFSSDEQVLSSEPVIAGLQTLNMVIPSTATPGETQARVRVSSLGGLSPIGLAPDGEVEDYRVNISDQTAIEVESVQVNDGSNQRSQVTSLTVTFDNITTATPEAFSVVNRADSSLVGINTVLNNVGGKTVATITFLSGANVVDRPLGNSLEDGNFELIIDQTQVVGLSSEFRYGDEAADAFFRLYGDTDGDRDVDGQDYGRFGLTFLKAVGDPAFNEDLDSDGDGDVDGQDYGRFGTRFLTTLAFE